MTAPASPPDARAARDARVTDLLADVELRVAAEDARPPLSEEQVDRAVQLLRPHLDVLREHAPDPSP